jgi:hypothetical protein
LPPVGDPHVHVVVVVRDRLHDGRRAAEADACAHEGELRAGGDEAADEVLRQGAVDVRDPLGSPGRPVYARVVDVDVEAVLV